MQHADFISCEPENSKQQSESSSESAMVSSEDHELS